MIALFRLKIVLVSLNCLVSVWSFGDIKKNVVKMSNQLARWLLMILFLILFLTFPPTQLSFHSFFSFVTLVIIIKIFFMFVVMLFVGFWLFVQFFKTFFFSFARSSLSSLIFLAVYSWFIFLTLLIDKSFCCAEFNWDTGHMVLIRCCEWMSNKEFKCDLCDEESFVKFYLIYWVVGFGLWDFFKEIQNIDHSFKFITSII